MTSAYNIIYYEIDAWQKSILRYMCFKKKCVGFCEEVRTFPRVLEAARIPDGPASSSLSTRCSLD